MDALIRMRKKGLRLAISSLAYYQREFYGWSAKYSPKAKYNWEQYEEAINMFKEELKSIKNKGKGAKV